LTYWEATGELKSKLIKLLDSRNELLKPLMEWCESHGGMLLLSEGISVNVGLGIENEKLPNGITNLKEPKNPQHWKRVKGHDEAWVPRLSSKEGKALQSEINKLARGIPTRGNVGTLIKLPWIGLEGLYFSEPQLYRVGKRVLLVIPTDKYKPVAGMKRISDLDFDKATNVKILKKDAIL
jgi:hypothetical protein